VLKLFDRQSLCSNTDEDIHASACCRVDLKAESCSAVDHKAAAQMRLRLTLILNAAAVTQVQLSLTLGC
jgi:hypothetical protein